MDLIEASIKRKLILALFLAKASLGAPFLSAIVRVKSSIRGRTSIMTASIV